MLAKIPKRNKINKTLIELHEELVHCSIIM